MGVWLLLLDLDGTLWNHLDISTLNPPFKRVRKGVIVDSKGVRVELYNDMVKLLEWAKSRNAITSTLSWNIREIAIEALRTFGILRLFDYLVIEPHPRKDLMLKKLLDKIEVEKEVEIPPCKIVYIDDRTIHVRDIYENIGKIHFLKAWDSFKNFKECALRVEELLSECNR